jgi:ParB-like chromosome segregation protein Spo0J
MNVKLSDLYANPYRDFTVDPIDPDAVDALADSIAEDGFWGGVVVRENEDGYLEIAAGHHRIEAAIQAGFKEADVFIGDFDDADMIRVYARENATQRGNTSTAAAGTVLAAVRYIAYAVMTGEQGFSQIWEKPEDLSKLQGNIASLKGIGVPVILAFLADVPGVNKASVTAQLANLKASNDYGRVIKEVQEQVEAENAEALEAAAEAEAARVRAEEEAKAAEAARKEAARRAKEAKAAAEKRALEAAKKRADAEAKLAEKRRKEQAAASAAIQKQTAKARTSTETARKAATVATSAERTFDMEGVAPVLKNQHQLAVFRKWCESPSVRAYLPIEQQAPLAKRIVAHAKELGAELTGSFISQNVGDLLHSAKVAERRFSKEEGRRLHALNYEQKAKALQTNFAGTCRSLVSSGKLIAQHYEKKPDGLVYPITTEFKSAIQQASRDLLIIKSKLGL